MRLLVVRLSAIGDVLQALPALELLRVGLPGAKLTWAVEGAAAPLLASHPALDRVVVIDRGGLGEPSRRPSALRGALEALRGMREASYDAALDLQGLLRSALVARATGAGRIFGPAWAGEGAAWLYSDRLAAPRPGEAHAAERYAAMARETVAALGGTAPRDGLPRPRLGIALDRPQDAGAPLLAILPGAGKPANRPPPALLAEVADRCATARPELSIALLGGRTDRSRAEAVIHRARVARPRDLCGALDLDASARWLAAASVVLGGDTGPLHLAAALQRPIVALFHAADPARTGPQWAAGPARTLAGAVECSPCRARRCERADRVRICLGAMPAARVADEVLSLLPR